MNDKVQFRAELKKNAETNSACVLLTNLLFKMARNLNQQYINTK